MAVVPLPVVKLHQLQKKRKRRKRKPRLEVVWICLEVARKGAAITKIATSQKKKVCFWPVYLL